MEAVLEECRAVVNLDLHAAGHKSQPHFHRFPPPKTLNRALFSGLVDSEIGTNCFNSRKMKLSIDLSGKTYDTASQPASALAEASLALIFNFASSACTGATMNHFGCLPVHLTILGSLVQNVAGQGTVQMHQMHQIWINGWLVHNK